MSDYQGEVIYVGKAKNLRNRLGSYFGSSQQLAPKTRALVSQIAHIEVILTHTEREALLLENTLIKEYLPRYNILLRDDKSYPYLFISNHAFPRITFHRGARREKGDYFGPYPSAGSIKESLKLLQRLFPIRQCEDSFFRHRQRPCLKHQIGLCSAPCVGLIDDEAYAEDVRHTQMFLQGRREKVMDELLGLMDQASGALKFELAAKYRDQISHLRQLQQRQYVVGSEGDIDVAVLVSTAQMQAVELLFIRDGKVNGRKSLFPKHSRDTESAELLDAIIRQYYLQVIPGVGQQRIPPQILVNHPLESAAELSSLLAEIGGHHKVKIRHVRHGSAYQWIEMAERNGQSALETQLQHKSHLRQGLELLQQHFSFVEPLRRIECFDISHSSGEGAVASCVVFNRDGAVKSHYRRFNIKDITPGDDYAAMAQAIRRRYLQREEGLSLGELPDLLLIDGGKGQIQQAVTILNELNINSIFVMGVAKGEGRRAGLERLILPGQKQAVILADSSPALHLIQQVRDEAHRFAVSGHRSRRARTRRRSVLEDIEGLGPKRRQTLIRHFGGIGEIKQASIEDLVRVKGVSKALAQRIYDQFNQ